MGSIPTRFTRGNNEKILDSSVVFLGCSRYDYLHVSSVFVNYLMSAGCGHMPLKQLRSMRPVEARENSVRYRRAAPGTL